MSINFIYPICHVFCTKTCKTINAYSKKDNAIVYKYFCCFYVSAKTANSEAIKFPSALPQ